MKSKLSSLIFALIFICVIASGEPVSKNESTDCSASQIKIGDTKETVKKILGDPIYDGDYYFKYGMQESIYFTPNGRVKSIVGFQEESDFDNKESFLDKTKKLQKLKAMGQITEKEYQKRKAKIIKANFETAEDRRLKKEVAEAAALASKTLEITIEKERQKATNKALADYKIMFPLHSAVKEQNKKQVLSILKEENADINAFDTDGKTAWDYAYSIQSATMSFELCNILKTAGGVASEEINKFNEEKKRAHLVNLKVSVGISYKLGGYQPFVGTPIALVKSSELPEVMSKYSHYFTIFRATGFNRNDIARLNNWDAAREALLNPATSLVSASSVTQISNTDSMGSINFQDLEPGSYVIVCGGPTRSGFANWFVTINCDHKENKITLTESNAYYID